MVSLWPFGRSSDSSTSTFEKTLHQLSDKITRSQTHLDTFRTKQRRFKALITLYGSFVYILVFLILTLVTGYEKWKATEWTAVAGSPVAIFGLRKAVDGWYEWRVRGTQAHLDALSKEREQVVKKLKAATKYDSTQELLEKYGGVTPKARGKSPLPPGPGGPKRKTSGLQQQQGQVQRTGFAPPPTANIPGRQPPPQNALDARLRAAPPPQSAPSQQESNESFAPNAFTAPSRSSTQQDPYATPGASATPAWYDRIMDLVLGEDETQAKNRIVLLCQSCRLVNGQAPPGIRTAEELGRWKCAGCGAWNGIESEASKVLKHAKEASTQKGRSVSAASAQSEEDHGFGHVESDVTSADEDVEVKDEEDSTLLETPPSGSTRSKAKQRKKA